ncbi:MAG: hypothetical protein IT207_01480 [Fimbriimonadaceae bacterium]|nr:hypothetical protein [Fimbriimonadaceae bacterium]
MGAHVQLRSLILTAGAFALAAQSSATGFTALAGILAAEAQRRELQLASPYGEKPGPVKTDTSGRRDESRSKWLGPRGEKALLEARMARMRDRAPLQANTGAYLLPMPLGGGGGGGGTGWEGAYGGFIVGGPGGGQGGGPGYGGGTGGFNNTATGNKQTVVPITGWGARGGLGVGLSLVHNSLDNDDFASLGKGWTHSYDVWMSHDPSIPDGPGAAAVHFADGLYVSYSKSAGVFSPPAGFFEKLVQDGSDDFTLTLGDQTRFLFKRLGGSGTTLLYLDKVKDRAGNTVTVNRQAATPYDVTSVVDPSGRTLTFSYASGRLTGVTGPGGRAWTFTQTDNRLTKVTWPIPVGSQYTTEFTYTTTLDNVASVKDRRGYVWTYEYDAASPEKIWKETSPETQNGGETVRCDYSTSYTDVVFENTGTPALKLRHNYDANGMLLSEVDEGGYSVSYHYNASNLVDRFTDERGYVWEATYDGNGNAETLKNPLGKVWSWDYNATNDLLWSKTPRQAAGSVQTTYDYWGAGQGSGKPEGFLRKVTDATGKELVKEVLYDGYSQVWKVKDGLDRTSEYTFDGDGDLTLAKRPDGTQTTAVYDDYGNPTSVTGPDSQTTVLEYDGMGRFVKATAPGPAATEVGLDGEGGVSWAKDALGKQWDLYYDKAGRLVERRSPRIDPVTLSRYKETYSYDVRGLLTKVTDGNGHSREYVRAPRGELWKVLHEDQRHADPAKHAYEVWQRYATGQVYRHRVPLSRDGSGDVVYTFIAYTIDQAGRTTAVDNPSPEVDSTLSYDDDGRLSSAVGPDGTSSWTRDLAGRTTQLAQPGGTLTYAYDAAGRLDTLAQAGRGTFDWAYDSYGRVASLTDPEGKVTSLEYDTAGRPWRRTLGNGLKEERSWDTRGRLSSFALKSAGGATLRSESWGYSSRSDVLSHTVDGGATAYTYDDEGQLLSESRTGYATSYTYDGNGNRKARVVNGATETYSYDVGDKLTGITYSGGGSRSFTYDLSGRMLTDTLNTRSFTWTADSRLASLNATTGNESYTYSAFGTRAKVGTRTFLRAGAGVTASVLDDGYADYTPGVSEVRSSVTTFSHCGLKNTGAQTDGGTTPSVQATRIYDAFGATQSSSGTWQGPSGYAGAFGYQTEGSGLHLLGHRYYDASLGRFLTRDPIGDGSNWYAYCENDPMGSADPDGLLHVVINIGSDGTGRMKVYADNGDVMPVPGTDGVLYREADEGNKLFETDASNNTRNPGGDRRKLGTNAPFPVERDLEIDGVYDRTRPSKTRSGWRSPVPGLGKHCLMLMDGSDAFRRGTWVHGGRGDNWRAPTEGCIRIREDDAGWFHFVFDLNKNNGNRHRLSVFDARVN